jgi:hypothetical protein
MEYSPKCQELRKLINIFPLSVNYGQRAIVQFLHEEKVHPTQIRRRLAAQYGLEI